MNLATLIMEGPAIIKAGTALVEGIEGVIPTIEADYKADVQQISTQITAFNNKLNAMKTDQGFLAKAEDFPGLVEDAANIVIAFGDVAAEEEASEVWSQLSPLVTDAETLYNDLVGSAATQAAAVTNAASAS